MILLVWASEKAKEIGAAIAERLKEEVRTAPTLQKGCELLRAGGYSAVLVDQWISEAEPARTDLLFECVGDAVPLFINFAINNQERVLRELRTALQRRQRESALVRQSAEVALRDELKDDVTALLLSCGVALKETGVTEPVNMRLQQIKQAADQIKIRLTSGEERAIAPG